MTREQWRKARARFCDGGKTFARKHKTLGEAWQKCENGCFMAFWLSQLDWRSSKRDDLKTLRPRQFDLFTGVDLFHIVGPATPDELKLFATRIRATYNSDGTRRKRSVR